MERSKPPGLLTWSQEPVSIPGMRTSRQSRTWRFAPSSRSVPPIGSNPPPVSMTRYISSRSPTRVTRSLETSQIAGGAMDIRSAQNLAWENKLAKGFNTTDVPLEFCLLNGEVAEAFDAWRKCGQDLAEELADAAIYLLGLAEMTGTDLQDAVEAKLAKNAADR